MAARRRRKKLPETPIVLDIEGLSHEGRGVARLEGKTHFVEGALPGEQVEARLTAIRGQYNEARAERILVASAQRVDPPCEYFGTCGGCSMQHMDSTAQIEHKQQILAELFAHHAGTQPEEWLPPMLGDNLGYRRQARLGVRYVAKKGRTLVGFREKQSNFLADIESCKVLDPRVSSLLRPLSELIDGLEARRDIPQIEVACGDNNLALVFRHLKPLSNDDQNALTEFAKRHDLLLFLQPKGPDTVHILYPQDEQQVWVKYRLAEFDLELLQHPLDFAQVNASINSKMVSKAIDLLDIQPNENVLDLFCGLGNFTLALARRAKHVVGIEGVQAMVERGRMNAQHNRLQNVEFYQADLFADVSQEEWNQRQYHKLLIDPARSGAIEIIDNVARFNASRIVYVSCNPSTLARDTGALVEQGYRLTKAGVMDMFPHTTHVESIAVFDKQ